MIFKQYILSARLLKMSEGIIPYVQRNMQFPWVLILFYHFSSQSREGSRLRLSVYMVESEAWGLEIAELERKITTIKEHGGLDGKRKD